MAQPVFAETRNPSNEQLTVEALLTARKPELTVLAHALETAEKLRRPGRPIEPAEEHEKLGDGTYSLASARRGGYKSALHSNRNSLGRHFEKALPYMVSQQWYGLINRTYWTILRYGGSAEELNGIMRKQGYTPRNSKGQTSQEAEKERVRIAEEEEIWAAYSPSPKGHRALDRLTTPVNESYLSIKR